jgi:hypothetical protein
MANIKISAAADAGTLLSSDMLPLARSGDTNAYHATMAEIASFSGATLASGAYGNVGRNLVHNGLFNVAQRGAGPFTAGGYTLDRWDHLVTTDTTSITWGTLGDAQRAQIGDEAATHSYVNVYTGNAAAGAFNLATQRLENVRRLGGKTVTVSFWAAAASGTPSLGISIDQFFGTGGSPSATVFGNGVAVPISATYTHYSATFSVPSTVGKTLGTNGDDWSGLNFWFSSGTNNATRAGNIGVQSGTIQLWGVQLEVGNAASPLEKLDSYLQAQQCMRFYELQNFYMGGGATAAGLGYGFTMPYVVPKRGLPTITLSNVTITNLTSTAVSTDGATNVQVYGISVAAGGYLYEGTFAASADL